MVVIVFLLVNFDPDQVTVKQFCYMIFSSNLLLHYLAKFDYSSVQLYGLSFSSKVSWHSEIEMTGKNLFHLFISFFFQIMSEAKVT